MHRYSKKRQAILDLIKSTATHPTAEWIYERLKPDYPNLSLATVYRNLIQLKELGEIKSIGTVMGQERFDGNTLPHTHALCIKCGRIADIPNIAVPEETVLMAQNSTGYKILSSGIRFEGMCPNCDGAV